MVKCALISGAGMGIMHGRNFNNHSDAKVVAVCEMNPDLLTKAKEEFKVPGYSTVEELLANCDAELMLLITNETRRIPPLRQLIAAGGRNVFTEKPLCGLEGQSRVQESDAGIAAKAIKEWRSSSVKFGIDYNYRFFRHFQMLHEDAVSGKLGEIQFVRARAHFACWSHIIDQILWTMGLPEWVSVLGDPSKPGGWHRLIHMKWANGVDGELTGADSWGWDEGPLCVMIVGDKCYAEAKGLEGSYRRHKSFNAELEERWVVEEGRQEYGESFARMADGVIKAMIANKPFPADGEAAWNEILFEAAVHRSARLGGEKVFVADVEKEAMK
jgi:myo-inositol 2-dehydrogenase/D-chiro-inositol 1-dehydrogenase